MIMIDELRLPSTGPLCFRRGSAHLTCDGEESELHAFALRLGLRVAWFQDHKVPHYDLTASRRDLALRLGAVFVTAREQAKLRRQAELNAAQADMRRLLAPRRRAS